MKYRIKKVGEGFIPQRKNLLWWRDIGKAECSLEEAKKHIYSFNLVSFAERKISDIVWEWDTNPTTHLIS